MLLFLAPPIQRFRCFCSSKPHPPTRLAKNRESAQRSRQRKKEHQELLQERVHQTNATLEALRLNHVQEAAPRLAEARAALLERYCAALSSRGEAEGGGDGEDVDMKWFLEAFGPFAEVGACVGSSKPSILRRRWRAKR